MEELELKAATRDIVGKKVKQLRRQGILPGVVFGHGVESVPIQIDLKEFLQVYRQAGKNALVTLKIDQSRKPRHTLIQSVTKNPRTGKPLHFNLYQVSMTEEITSEVPLTFINEAPAVKISGGVVLHNLANIQVKCLPGDLPHNVEIDLSGLSEIDQSLYVRDLQVSEKVQVLTDPDELVVKILPPRVEEVAAPPPEAEVVPIVEEAARAAPVESETESEGTSG